jgi:ribosomal protein L37AE/L43A
MTRQQIIYWALLSLTYGLPLALWSSVPLWVTMLLSPLLAFASLQGLAIYRRRSTTSARAAAPAAGQYVRNQKIDVHNRPACPHCGAAEVVKIIYGKPPLTRQLLEDLESGRVISGGCMIHSGAPEWHCSSCNNEFGQLNFDLLAEKQEVAH